MVYSAGHGRWSAAARDPPRARPRSGRAGTTRGNDPGLRQPDRAWHRLTDVADARTPAARDGTPTGDRHRGAGAGQRLGGAAACRLPRPECSAARRAGDGAQRLPDTRRRLDAIATCARALAERAA